MPTGPLAGLRIIEMECIGPGPFTGMHLADLGAEVILVERPAGKMDASTDIQDNILKRGKKSISLDMKDPDDKETVLKLIETADALIEGMRPGVMERLGLGPKDCLKRNPVLVYGRLTGWGQDGPLATAAGHDPNYIGLSGATWYAGQPGAAPVSPVTLVGDVGGGAHYMVIGILAGILQAKATGKGDIVDAAMVDGSAHMMNLILSLRPGGMMQNDRGKSVLDGPSWMDAYECSDGAWINLAPLEAKFYKKFIELMGLANDPLFQDQYNPIKWDGQKAALTRIFKSKSQDHWCCLLEGTDACFAPILSPDAAAKHPHMRSRKVYSSSGILQARAAPVFASAGHIRPGPVPAKGQHTEEILASIKT